MLCTMRAEGLWRQCLVSDSQHKEDGWTLTAKLQRRIQAMKMRCYRKILHITYKDHVTNEEVHAKIQQAIGPHEDLPTIVKRCKLPWYDYVFLHQFWPKPSCEAQWKKEEDEADRGSGRKTISGNGQAWSSPSPRGQWRTRKIGGNWLWNHLWLPDDSCAYEIDDNDDDNDDNNDNETSLCFSGVDLLYLNHHDGVFLLHVLDNESVLISFTDFVL